MDKILETVNLLEATKPLGSLEKSGEKDLNGSFDSSENFNGRATCQTDLPIVFKQITIRTEFEYACCDCLHQN